VLIFLGGLDSMLSWRGGFPPNDFYLGLLAAGLLLYAAGAIRRGGQKSVVIPANAGIQKMPGSTGFPRSRE
jgi:hypothetical protein